MARKKTIEKSIKNLEKRKQEHIDKINKGKIDKLDETIIDYWKKEIDIFEREIQKNKQKLKKTR